VRKTHVKLSAAEETWVLGEEMMEMGGAAASHPHHEDRFLNA